MASEMARPVTPHLLATYDGMKGVPRRPAAELVMMIDPLFCATRWSAQALTVFHTPVRLMSIVSCQISSVHSFHGVGKQIPAFATTMSSPPSSLTAVAAADS